MSLLIGVASYLAPTKLRRTLETLRTQTIGEWRCVIIHNEVSNNEDDAQAQHVGREFASADSRFSFVSQANSFYSGAVNRLLEIAVNEAAEFVVHCDNDIEILTYGWNAQMESLLRSNPECAWVFPGDGHFPLENGRYRECLWHAGYCFMLSMAARQKLEDREREMFTSSYLRAGYINAKLGHHEEVCLMVRLRLAGFTTACIPGINVIHHETATRADDANHKPGGRIHDGVVRWMNFYNRYFCGDQLQYSMTAYDARALRYTDWNVDALYLERMTLHYFPNWNARPRTVNVPGVGEMDVIEVLKPKGCYAGRAI